MNDKLKAKVAAVNRANSFAHELYRTLEPIFKPLVGQKIEKVDGQLLEKYKKLLPTFPNTVDLSVYKHVSNYSLAWVVKTCESILPNSCCYHETMVYIGNMRNGVLESMHQPLVARTDYSAEEVVRRRAAFELADKAKRDAEAALYPFGQYDN